MRTAGNPARAAALANVEPNLSITQTIDRRQIQAQIVSSPLLVGMRGLLGVGVTLTVALALLGSMMQAALDWRSRPCRTPSLPMPSSDAVLDSTIVGVSAERLVVDPVNLAWV